VSKPFSFEPMLCESLTQRVGTGTMSCAFERRNSPNLRSRLSRGLIESFFVPDGRRNGPPRMRVCGP
jgi:hypothetical protein